MVLITYSISPKSTIAITTIFSWSALELEKNNVLHVYKACSAKSNHRLYLRSYRSAVSHCTPRPRPSTGSLGAIASCQARESLASLWYKQHMVTSLKAISLTWIHDAFFRHFSRSRIKLAETFLM